MVKVSFYRFAAIATAAVAMGAGIVPVAAAAPGATVVQASITFHTNDEDKDHDTHVKVLVTDRKQTQVAEIDDDFGQFRDNSDHGPYPLYILNPSSWDDLHSGGTTQIVINPNGHDTWRFNFHLDLLFSDGSHLGTNVNGVELAQDRNSQTWGIR
jgi:hypothetical protein